MAQNLKNRKSVLALVQEVTEGVAKAPATASEYVALQEGFDFNPQFSELESAELQDSIGQGKTMLGSESPTMTFSHYLKHSGVEGKAPAYGILLHSLLGNKRAIAVEEETVAGSTTEIIKVDAGKGANFKAGQAVLIKDPVNGYSIRNVKRVNVDELELSFVTKIAPGAGVKLGKAVHYEGVSEGHPSLTVWGYRANGGAIEVISGGKVTEMSVDITAGELINANFSIAGTAYYYDPIEVTANNKYLDIDDNGDVEVVVVPEGYYKDPHDLAEKLEQNLNALGGSAFTVKYSDSTGKFTISSDADLELLVNTGVNAANGIASLLGFNTAADLTGAQAYTSDVAINLRAPHVPVYDQSNPIVAKANEVLFGDKDQIACFKARSVNISISNEQERIPDLCADSGFEGTENTSRSFTATITATLSQYDADKYKKFRKGDTVAFTYNLGEKIGGDWVGGKCINIYMPYATISSFKIGDANGIATLEMSVRAFVDSGASEVHVNCL